MEKFKVKVIMAMFYLIPVLSSHAQELKPSNWEIKFSRTGVAENDTVTLYFIGKIPENQGVYSTKFECDYGPSAARVIFENPGKNYTVIDSSVSVGDVAEFDDIFGCTLKKFKKVAIIKQIIKISNKKALIKGKLEYQACTNEMCLQYYMYFETKGTRVLKVENGK
jgi:thiol:disulfide interchange protein DsbD